MILPMYKQLPARKKETNPETIQTFHRYASICILMLIAGLSGYFSWRLIKPRMDSRMDFYNNLWAPVYLLVHGQSPYNTSSLHPLLPALWFPMSVGFFSPLGFLNESVATKVWFVFNILELSVVILLSLGRPIKFYLTAIVGFLVFLFPPFLHHLLLGQFTITAMFCLTLAAYFAGKERNWVAAFFLALGLTKPQLGFLAFPGLLFFYSQRGGLKAAFRFGLQTSLMIVLTTLPLFIITPQWIPDWLASMRSNSTWLHPSLFSILRETVGAWAYIPWGIAALIGLAICYRLWKELSPFVAMLWSLALTTILTPYVWSWDFVLLLPILVYTFTKVNWRRRLLLLGAYWVGWLGLAYVQLLTSSSNHLFWWVPFWYVGSVLLVTLWRQDRPVKQSQTA